MRTRRIGIGSASVLATEDNDVTVARGIRYATAERFAVPQPVPAYAGPIDATVRGPACPQLPSRLEFATGPVVDGLQFSEHCQVLSVTAPTGAARLPVMVWFHGGAYVSGGGEAAKYDPHALATEGQVVVVTVTYRLGVFGYLNLHDPQTQNLGLRDQLCALRWVRDNIVAFGGDPARVTIFGQSAGGDSVMALMMCEESAGLFTGAILHSAPLGLRADRSKLTAAMRDAAMTALGTVSAHEAGVEQLLEAQVAAAAAARRFGRLGMMPFAPLLGMAPLPPAGEILERIAEAASRVDILVGYTRDDGRPFVTMDPRTRRLCRLGPPGALLAAAVGRTFTRQVFGRPATELVDDWARAGGRSASFRVDWAPPQAPLGACHCIELPLLLGSPAVWADAPMLGPDPDPIDDTVARRVRALWSGFAHDGVAALETASLTIG